MKFFQYTFIVMLFLASSSQNTIAQQSILDGEVEREFEGELETESEDQREPAEPSEPSVRPRLKRVSEISLNLFDQPSLNTDGELQVPKPEPMSVSNNDSASRYGATPKVVSWTAPDVAYRQLIFEEPGLERHGFTDGEVRQHIRSSASFYARSIALPIILYQQRNWPCDNNLGWGTPGTCPK